ncbi:MAG TPA: carbonic anhydrase [Verrucomicrobiae bacterium]|nr:carbonic anhydrase [Verrucomicrobiae bacterium]
MSTMNHRSIRVAALLFFTAIFQAVAYAAGPTSAVSADDAITRLKAGNERFVAGNLLHPNATPDRRADVAKGQAPFAIIVGCSDSRVGPEVVFDQGLGDLFVVRTAGNVVDDVALGSIEYAADHLGAPVILVLGHTRCGAVAAAVAGGEAPGHIGSIVEKIEPAVKATKGMAGDPVDNAVRANVRNVVRHLHNASPILSKLIKAGKLRVVGACYDLDSGRVDYLE